MKANRAIIFLLLFLSNINLLFSKSVSDSLLTLLAQTSEDTFKVNLLKTLSLALYFEPPDSALIYAEESIILAQKLDYTEGIANANYAKGRIFLEKSRHKDCIIYAKKALQISEEENLDQKLIGDTHLLLGRAYDFLGDYFHALTHFQESIKHYRDINFLKGVGNVYINIGIIHHRIKDYNQALEYYHKAEAEYKLLKDSIGLIYVYNNIGFIDYTQKNYVAAEDNYLKGIALSNEISFEALLPFFYNNLGSLYDDLKENGKAESMFTKALEVSRKVNNEDGISTSLMALASMHYKDKNYNKYLDDVLWCHEEATLQGNKDLIKQTSELLSEMFDFNGNKTMAFDYLNIAYEMQDSLNNNSLIEETSRLERQFLMNERKKEEKLELAKKDKEIKTISYLILGIGCLFIGFLYLKTRQNKAKDKLNLELRKKNALLIDAEKNLELRNEELEKYIASNIKLEQFAHFASHDLKSPIRTIYSFTGLLKKSLENKDEPKVKECLKAIENGTRRMNDLIIDLLNHATINSQALVISKFAFIDVYEEAKMNLSEAINRSDATLNVHHDNIEIEADKVKIRQVLENLIGNAIKFSSLSDQPQVDISIVEQETQFKISVHDNGIGIEEKYQKEIFKEFIQLNPISKFEGTGLGLTICKNIVDKHRGEIWVKSSEDSGTTVQFSIPKEI